MGLFGALTAPGRKSVDDIARALSQLPEFLMGPSSKTGIAVTWSTALQVTAMLACCKVVGEGIAQSRCRLMQPRPAGGFEAAVKHPLYRLLYRKPNKWQSAFEFWETIVFHLLLVGNAYVFVNRLGSGDIYELLIVEPQRVAVTRLPDLSLVYDVTMPETQRLVRLTSDQIWHIRGSSWNGWMGMETVRLAREALGLSLALEESHAALHKNGAQPSGTYSVEGTLTKPQYDALKEYLRAYAASDKSTPMILDNGTKWLTQQMSGVDAEHVATRKLQIEEVCRPVRVIPLMIGQSDKTATFASVEQLLIAHVMHCLLPMGERIEQSAAAFLLTEKEQATGFELKFNFNNLMRGDFKSLQEGLQIQRRNGVINANQWLEMLGMNPRTDPGGEQFIVEANMALQDGRDLPAVQTPAKPPADPKDS